MWGYNRCYGVDVGCGAFRDNDCKVGDKLETLCLSSGLFQTILCINQQYACENGKEIMGNAEQECLCAYASHVDIRSILVSGKLLTYPPSPHPSFLMQHFALSEK